MIVAWLDFNRAAALAVGIVLAGGLFGAGVEVSSALGGDEVTSPDQAAVATSATPTATALSASPIATAEAPAHGHGAPVVRPVPTGAPHGAVAATEAPLASVSVAPTAEPTAGPVEPTLRPTQSAASPTRAPQPAGAPQSRANTQTQRPAPVRTTAAKAAPASVVRTTVVGAWTVPTIVPPGNWTLSKPQLNSGAPVQISVSGCDAGCAFAAGELFIKAPAGRITITWSAPAIDGFTSWSQSTSANWG